MGKCLRTRKGRRQTNYAGSLVTVLLLCGAAARSDEHVVIHTVDDGPSAGTHTSIAIGVDGLPIISYGSEGRLKVAHCSDSACSAATLTTIGFAGLHYGQMTSIAIGSDDRALISNYHSDSRELLVSHCSDVICSSATTTILDSVGLTGHWTSVAIGSDGLGLISYQDLTNNDLKVAHCDNVLCTSATLTTLESTGNVGEYTSVAIGMDGLGLISYRDFTNGATALKVAHCSNITCTSATIATLDTADNPGFSTSVVIGTDGLGLISYGTFSSPKLKVAHCNNTACSSATISTVDSASGVGQASSLAIGSEGYGVISYHDSTNQALKVAQCTNTACSSATTGTLDSLGNTGLWTSVAIGVNDKPIISYYDNTNQDLKVAAFRGLELLSFTVDTGGGRLGLAGSFELVGTAGQHDAIARADWAGGDFTVQGGFWFGIGDLDPPPRVLLVNSVADTGDGMLGEGEITSRAITELLVTFSEDVQDNGASDPDSVTNPDNYLLFSGQNTVDCAGGLADGDTAVAIDAVNYSSDTRTATLAVNGGVAMFDGDYRLHVCGSTSIRDDSGNALDGNGDGSAGDDFIRSFSLFQTRPSADAGPDLALNLSLESGELGGSPSGYGGTPPLSYEWTITPDSGFSLTSPTAPNPSFRGTSLGSYTAELEVTDANGFVAADTATVIVECNAENVLQNSAINSELVVSAHNVLRVRNVFLHPGAQVTLVAGLVVQIENSLEVNGGTLVVGVDPTLLCPIASSPLTEALASDSNGDRKSFESSLAAESTLPIADAGPSRTLGVDLPTILGGLPSAMGGEPPYIYRWTINPKSGFTLSSSTAPNPEFVGSTPDSYVAKLEVRDVNGQTATDPTTVVVQCLEQVNHFGISLGGTQVVEAGSIVTAEEVTIAAEANVTFVAGEQVSLGNGHVVEDGAIFRVVIDSTACAPLN